MAQNLFAVTLTGPPAVSGRAVRPHKEEERGPVASAEKNRLPTS